jgi:histone-lysine N-methyltransferase SETMAR
MTERLEQRYCIKFCQKLGDTQVKTIHKFQQAFGDDAMRISHIKQWFNRFKDGRTSMDSEPRPGRHPTSRNDNVIDQVRTLVMQDRRITVRELAIEVEVSTESVHSILAEDLSLKRVSSKFVPRLLTMEQKQLHLEIACWTMQAVTPTS